ncbi:L-aspartate oxidase [Gracilibacillus oryzae]|uniref:L-aspartate oxidase n=1 Tax=Gracilibacillus oryzae TaxID=1672701 RepID=A0A7C8GT31_9BACI|nr:L-aspartate oxidase [Gracilibacillus oryzae]KAB8134744.1 L-aspartate oxidase [Gracilibacillus oryzae]
MRKPKVLIIGAGIAAHIVASKLFATMDVVMITKKSVHANNSVKAQGGVAAAIAPDDCWYYHYQDTLTAGGNYNEKKAVQFLTKEGIVQMLQLISQLPVDKNFQGNIDFGREGAHKLRRIIHLGGDQTGKLLMHYYQHIVRGKVEIIENHTAVDCLMEDNKCIGMVTIDEADSLHYHYADHIILATGGCGALYQATSNDPTVTGDGIAIAYRAGAVVKDMEFVQFHPTMIKGGKGLISEAVRGEGAVLVDSQLRPIMKDYHPDQDLAPRDIVARAIFAEEQKGNTIFLQMNQLAHFKKRFPQVTELCEMSHINLENGLIPVTPCAHFLMGGIKVNLDGESTIPNLYAVGEAACTGVHGANRLASNSLLEAIVFGDRLAKSLKNQKNLRSLPANFSQPADATCEEVFPAISELKMNMTKYAGIVRSEDQLTKMKLWLEQYKSDLPLTKMTRQQVEICHMLWTAYLITTSALKRKSSIGAHYRKDSLHNPLMTPIERQKYVKEEVLS